MAPSMSYGWRAEWLWLWWAERIPPMLGKEPLLLEYACRDCIGGSNLYMDWLCLPFCWSIDLG